MSRLVTRRNSHMFFCIFFSCKWHTIDHGMWAELSEISEQEAWKNWDERYASNSYLSDPSRALLLTALRSHKLTNFCGCSFRLCIVFYYSFLRRESADGSTKWTQAAVHNVHVCVFLHVFYGLLWNFLSIYVLVL